MEARVGLVYKVDVMHNANMEDYGGWGKSDCFFEAEIPSWSLTTDWQVRVSVLIRTLKDSSKARHRDEGEKEEVLFFSSNNTDHNKDPKM